MAVISTLQTGTASFTVGGGTGTLVTLTSVNTQNAFPIIGVMSNSDASTSTVAHNALYAVQFLDSTSLYIFKRSDNLAGTVSWAVPEFSSGVTMQQGTAFMSATTINVPINSVTTGQTFCLSNAVFVGAVTSQSFQASSWAHMKLLNATSVQFVIASVGSCTVYWRVVDYTGVNVQRGVAFLGSLTLQNVISITAVDTTATTVTCSWRSGANFAGGALEGFVLNGTTLVINRLAGAATNNATEASWETVEFTDGTLVMTGSSVLGASQLTTSAGFTSVNTGNSVIWMNGGYGHIARSRLNNRNVADPLFINRFTSSTSALFQRFTAVDSASIAWSIIQFNTASGVVTDTGSSNDLSSYYYFMT